MPIDLDKHLQLDNRQGDSSAAPPLVPATFEDADSHAFERYRQEAVVGLDRGTKLLTSVLQSVMSSAVMPAAAKTLGQAADQAMAALPEGARGYLESLRPVTTAVVLPLEEQRRQAGVAEVAGALAQQKAVLRQLARIGAPLSTLRAVARGQTEGLHAAGLMAGDRAALERAWDEELAGNRLLGRLQHDVDLPLADQPEAALLEPETLRHLEGLQRQRQADRQTETLDGLLRGATAGQVPTPEQAAMLAEALPGLGEAAAAETAASHRKQDAILALVQRNPLLGKLKDLAGGGALYRRLLVEQQRRAGVPETDLRLWDKAESDAAVSDLIALPDEDAPAAERSAALVAYARQHLAGLPAELRPLAIAELTRRGLEGADAAALGAVADDLAAGRDIAALGTARAWAGQCPAVLTRDAPGLIQVADSGEIASDADPDFVGSGTQLAQFAPPYVPPLGPLAPGSGGYFDPGNALQRLFDNSTWSSPAQTDYRAGLPALSLGLQLQATVREQQGGASFDSLPPQKPEPAIDFDIEEAARIAKDFFGPLVTPADLVPIFQVEGFSLDDFVGGAISEIFPDSRHELPQVTILENSRGNAATQWLVSRVGEVILQTIEQATGQETAEIFGGEARSKYRKERHLLAPEGGQKKYGRPDFSVRIPGTGYWLHVNTVDADRFGNPTEREHTSALRILRNTSYSDDKRHLGDVIVLLPKLRDGESYDAAPLRELFEELVRAMASADWEFRWVERRLDSN